MKISFIADVDFANVLTEYSYCLNKHSDNIESKSICFRKHTFNYSIQHDYDLGVSNNEQITSAKKFVEDSDIIVFAEEQLPQGLDGLTSGTYYGTLERFSRLLSVDLINSNKKICIWHAGSMYRQQFSFYNQHPQRNKIHKHLYGIDLYRLSNKEPNDLPIHAYQYIDFKYEEYITNFKSKLKSKPWTILHIPSNVNTKGTNQINEIINKLNLDPTKFKYKTITNITHPQVMEEKKKSIFYIDQFYPSKMGGYAVSSLESLFTSNLTFSTINNISDSMYKLTGKYECPVVSLGITKEEFQTSIETYIINSDESKLIEYMEGIGKWLETYYSPKSIVNYFTNI